MLKALSTAGGDVEKQWPLWGAWLEEAGFGGPVPSFSPLPGHPEVSICALSHAPCPDALLPHRLRDKKQSDHPWEPQNQAPKQTGPPLG